MKNIRKYLIGFIIDVSNRSRYCFISNAVEEQIKLNEIIPQWIAILNEKLITEGMQPYPEH